MSKRLEILKNSLEKKTARFDDKISDRFAFQAKTNGQPMNDKRDGVSFFKACDKKDDALRNLDKEIEKTKEAIEREESKINYCQRTLEGLPSFLVNFLDSGKITQWRKFPNRFFVNGGGGARIIFETDKKTKKLKLSYSHYNLDNCTHEEGKVFKAVFNEIFNLFNQGE